MLQAGPYSGVIRSAYHTYLGPSILQYVCSIQLCHSLGACHTLSDGDGDGYGDNPNGLNPDIFPNDSTQWSDADGDGYEAGADCDDSDPNINPGETEIDDGIDNNCDGLSDVG